MNKYIRIFIAGILAIALSLLLVFIIALGERIIELEEKIIILENHTHHTNNTNPTSPTYTTNPTTIIKEEYNDTGLQKQINDLNEEIESLRESEPQEINEEVDMRIIK